MKIPSLHYIKPLSDSWTIHGLWPDYCDGTYPQFCDSSREYSNIKSIVAVSLRQSTADGKQHTIYIDDVELLLVDHVGNIESAAAARAA